MLLEDMAAVLESEGEGTLGVDLFLWNQPDAPDRVICLFGYPGKESAYEHDSHPAALVFPRFAVNVRDPEPNVAASIAADVESILTAIRNQTINGTCYLAVRAITSGGMMAGRDASDRYTYVTRYEATISR